MRFLFVIFLATTLQISSDLIAQIPNNLEFLEHELPNSHSEIIKVTDDAIIYYSKGCSCPNECRGTRTQINRINSDNSFEVLLSSQVSSWGNTIKIFEENDSTYQILIYNVVINEEYPGFYVLNISNDEVLIDTVHLKESWSPKSYISSVEKDKNNNWIFIKDSIYSVNKTEFVSAHYKNIDGYNFELVKNSKGNIYAIENHKFRSTNIYSLENYVLEEVSSDSSRGLTYLAHYENGNYLNYKNTVILYDPDYSVVLHEWPEDFFQGDIIDGQFMGNYLQVLTKLENEYFTYKISSDFEVDLMHTYTSDTKETITKIESLGGDQFLISGDHRFENSTYYSFLRNINLSSNEQMMYPKSNIAITDLQITQVDKDTFRTQVINAGDTIFHLSYTYLFSMTIKNSSDESLSFANVFSSAVNEEGLSCSPEFINLETTGIPSHSSISIDTIIKDIFVPLQAVSFTAIGADHKFNLHDESILETIAISEIEKISKLNHLNIFPNPAEHQLTLDTKHNISTITIYNSSGTVVYFSNKTESVIDISRLSSGSYFILATNANQKSKAAKFIKL